MSVVNRGRVISAPRIHFVFWGSYWLSAGAAEADLIVRSFSRVPSAYFGGLSQYGVSAPVLAGMTVATAYEPPNYTTEGDVATMLASLISNRVLPHPGNSSFYVVIFPKGILSPYRGYHTYLRNGDDYTAPFSWVTTNGDSTIPDVFHELIEGMTDPEGSGVQTMQPVKSDSHWSEIADACESCQTSKVRGVPVPAYWSQADGACIAPGSRLNKAMRPQLRP